MKRSDPKELHDRTTKKRVRIAEPVDNYINDLNDKSSTFGNFDGYVDDEADDDLLEQESENSDADSDTNMLDVSDDRSLQSKPHQIEGQEDFSLDTSQNTGDIPIIPYNMVKDLEEGDIDKDGHYIRKKVDTQAIHDTWLQGVTQTDMNKANLYNARKLARQRIESDVDGADRADETIDQNDLWCRLLNVLKPGESVLTALSRFKAVKKRGKKAPPPDPSVEQVRKKSIEKITEVADKLMALGEHDVYESRYEMIVRKMRIAEVLGDDWAAGMPAPEKQRNSGVRVWYEYKWTAGAEEVFGPFSGTEMRDWTTGGYFGGYPEMVIRKCTVNSIMDPAKGFQDFHENLLQ